MDIEESKELLKKELTNTYSEKKAKAIETVLNELDKKDKIIDLMAEHIEKGCDFDNSIKTKEQIIDHFTNKYEEGKG